MAKKQYEKRREGDQADGATAAGIEGSWVSVRADQGLCAGSTFRLYRAESFYPGAGEAVARGAGRQRDIRTYRERDITGLGPIVRWREGIYRKRTGVHQKLNVPTEII